MATMIAVDVGNTRIHVAWINEKGVIIKNEYLDSSRISLPGLRRFFSKGVRDPIVVCSVVPRVTALFRRLRGDLFFQKKKAGDAKPTLFIVGEDLRVPLQCHYNQKSIGMDRLVGVYAAHQYFPPARLVIDFGTAVTFDFITKKGDYRGGLILPGLGSSLRVLSSCAMLPKKIILSRTRRMFPQDTQESISKGIEEGFSAMINGLVYKYKKSLAVSENKGIVITGGEASFIMPKLNFPHVYVPSLVMKGLEALYVHSFQRTH